jgi:hypothetical protein
LTRIKTWISSRTNFAVSRCSNVRICAIYTKNRKTRWFHLRTHVTKRTLFTCHHPTGRIKSWFTRNWSCGFIYTTRKN